MKSVSALYLSIVLLLFVGICGAATGCVTAQQQRNADIGPGTFPSSLPESTPNADRAPPKPTERQPARSARPSPSPSSGQINQSILEIQREEYKQ